MCEKHAKVAKEKSEMEMSSEEKEREVEEEKRRQQGQVTSLEGKIEQLAAKNGQLGAHVEELQVVCYTLTYRQERQRRAGNRIDMRDIDRK